jgi:mono/diheme cytochrome c family protein
MNHFRKFLAVTMLVVALSGLATSVAFAQDPDNGKVNWEEQSGCKNCHGDAAEGKWAGPLAGSEKTAQEWIDQVRNPRRNMPALTADQIPDEAIIDLHAYVSSLTKIEDFTPMDAGLAADAPQGQVLLVEKRCAACHSTNGPVGGFVKRGELPTVEGVVTQVRTPRNFMPSYTADQVSDDELALITDFLLQQASAEVAPAALPQSGGTSTNWSMILLLTGLGLVTAGFGLFKKVLN